MAYCTIADVNKLVAQQPFTSQTVPSQAQVEGFISDCSVEMDSLLKLGGYVVPVTAGPNALQLLRQACSWGAAGLAQDARNTAVLRDEQVAGGRNVWTQRWVEWKKAVVDARVLYDLIDAQRTEDAVVKPLGRLESSTDKIADGSYDYLSNPPFTIGMKL